MAFTRTLKGGRKRRSHKRRTRHTGKHRGGMSQINSDSGFPNPLCTPLPRMNVISDVACGLSRGGRKGSRKSRKGSRKSRRGSRRHR